MIKVYFKLVLGVGVNREWLLMGFIFFCLLELEMKVLGLLLGGFFSIVFDVLIFL